MTAEDQISEWFPYESYRPHQDEMLRAVYDAVSNGKTILINAPTGSGKSSNIAAVLAATTVRPVIVAVRTVSQLNIFVRELEMIRRNKHAGLKFCYIMGKGKVCRVYGEFGVNDRCKMLKKASSSRIKHDDIQADLSGQSIGFDAANPTYCPWYVKSKDYKEDFGKITDSKELCDKADAFRSTLVDTDEVKQFAGAVCPYEMMRRASQDCDVIIVNYQHVLNPTIRRNLLGRFYQDEDEKPVLMIDEAHNLGNSLEELHSVQIDRRTIEKALEEHTRSAVLEALGDDYNATKSEILPVILEKTADLIKDHDGIFKGEEIFDYQWLWNEIKSVLVDSCKFFDEVYESLEGHQNNVDGRVKKPDAEDESCKSLLKMVGFFSMLSHSMVKDPLCDPLEEQEDMSIVKIFVKNQNGSALKLRSIDPSHDALELMEAHGSIVLMSGTLHPPEVYGKYLFGDESAGSLAYISLPNVFPEENRKLAVCVDVTTTYKAMNEKGGDILANENNLRIFSYIHEFVRLPGNIAVYFPSYSMLRKYAYMIETSKYGKLRKFYVEPQNAREAARILEEYMGLPARGESGVLLAVAGGKFSEGIDYRGDTMVGVMVVGLPLSAYSPVMKQIIRYYEKKFGTMGNFIAYTLPALNRAQQALGRVIRTEKDRGFLVLCERRYLENMKSLPKWMKDEAERCVCDEFHGLVIDWKESGTSQ
jgi:DNA excision repair protein ERCC-2